MLLAECRALQIGGDSVVEMMASVVGVLFSAGVLSQQDVHLCLDCLFQEPTEVAADAIYALIVQTDDTLCQPTATFFMNQFLAKVVDYYIAELPYMDTETEFILEVSKDITIFKSFKLKCHRLI